MSDELAALGLDLAATTEAVAAPVVVTEKVAKAPRVEVEIGEVVISADEDLPSIIRAGATGSKYPFDKLTAPVAKTLSDGSAGFGYSVFKVDLLPGVDHAALTRSVQSATTQANSKAKADKTGEYFISRSIVLEGKTVGMKVFRVDATLEKTEEKAA